MSVRISDARSLEDASERRDQARLAPFRLVTVRGARPRSGVLLDQPRTIDVQEDEAIFARGCR